MVCPFSQEIWTICHTKLDNPLWTAIEQPLPNSPIVIGDIIEATKKLTKNSLLMVFHENRSYTYSARQFIYVLIIIIKCDIHIHLFRFQCFTASAKKLKPTTAGNPTH